jgi:hypothetical protein
VPAVLDAVGVAAVMVAGTNEMGRGADGRQEDLEP